MVPAGSVLFYDHNILHRATYPISPDRGIPRNDRHLILMCLLATLHGCMSSATHAGPERARVILQHDLNWMKSMKLPDGSRASEMRDRLVKMADQRELAYSLDG